MSAASKHSWQGQIKKNYKKHPVSKSTMAASAGFLARK